MYDMIYLTLMPKLVLLGDIYDMKCSYVYPPPLCQQSLSYNSTKKKGLCINRVKSLLSMRKLLLGHSFKPRPSLYRTPRRHIDLHTEGSILTYALSKI